MIRAVLLIFTITSFFATNQALGDGYKYIETCITERAGWTWCYTIEFLKNPFTFFICRDLDGIGYPSRMCAVVNRLNLYD